eukprot:m.148115 g.148115  ORF g.148115 m.148115 type:complete len:209 (-) comp16125_c1_seq15:1213-1839(-)
MAEVYVHLKVGEPSILSISPHTVALSQNVSEARVYVTGLKRGQTQISFSLTSLDPRFNNATLPSKSVRVVASTALVTINQVIGWIYFVAWSVSFYPQILENFRRKSVVGLNFDFLALNLTGFLGYMVFNVGLYYIPSIQHDYARRHPGATNPVQTNDVFFSIHAVAVTAFTIFQCCIYEVYLFGLALCSFAWMFLSLVVGLFFFCLFD